MADPFKIQDSTGNNTAVEIGRGHVVAYGPMSIGTGGGTTPPFYVAQNGLAYMNNQLLATAPNTTQLIQPSGDTSGVTDTANIQTLINSHASGGTVVLGNGTFYLDGTGLTPASNVRITGQGSGAGSIGVTKGTILVNVNGNVFNGGASNYNGVEIDHLTLEATGGHVITGMGLSGTSKIHDVEFVQNSYNYSIWDHNNLYLFSTYIYNVRSDVYSGPNSTVASGSNGGEISQIASWSSPSAGVLDVGSVTGWATSGTVAVAASGLTTAVVNYTGVSGASLTGCTYVGGSASGTVSTGGTVTPATRSVPGWNFYNMSGGYTGPTTFEKFIYNNNGSDNTQYAFVMATAASAGPGNGQEEIVFRDFSFSACFGGCIALYSCSDIQFYSVSQSNYSSGAYVLGNSGIYVGPSSGSRPSSGVSFYGCGTNTPPSSALAGSSWWDIQLDSTTDSVLICNPAVSAKLPANGGLSTSVPYINVGSATNVVIIDPQASTVISNSGADTAVFGNGGMTLGGVQAIQNTNTPDTNNLLVWNFDPVSSQTTGSAPTAAYINLARVAVKRQITVSKVWWDITSAGSGADSGESWAGLYNSSGTLLGSVGIDSTVTGSGAQSATLSVIGGQSLTLAPGTYYVVILYNASSMPVLARAQGNLGQGNVGTSGATLRWATQSTFTGLANLTLASNGTTNCFPYWMGLS